MTEIAKLGEFGLIERLTKDIHPQNSSTLYGVGGEFGMSTFTLITEKGDTLNVTRTALDGTDGEVYGSLREGDRYAMTTRDNGEAIGVLINLTELERKVKKFDVVNGHVVAEGDTLQLDKLL